MILVARLFNISRDGLPLNETGYNGKGILQSLFNRHRDLLVRPGSSRVRAGMPHHFLGLFLPPSPSGARASRLFFDLEYKKNSRMERRSERRSKRNR